VDQPLNPHSVLLYDGVRDLTDFQKAKWEAILSRCTQHQQNTIVWDCCWNTHTQKLDTNLTQFLLENPLSPHFNILNRSTIDVDAQFHPVEAFYGTKASSLSVLEHIQWWIDEKGEKSKLLLPKGSSLNEVFRKDPCQGKSKSLFLTCEIKLKNADTKKFESTTPPCFVEFEWSETEKHGIVLELSDMINRLFK